MIDGANGRLSVVDKDELFAEAEKLAVDDKLELVKLLVNPLHVVLGGTNQMNGSIIVQINMADAKTVASVLEAISNRLNND